jgi:signal transduction histidine kinase
MPTMNFIIKVEDNGRGIPENLVNLLGRAQLTYGKTNGNGIGLNYVFENVEKHGGTVQIFSKENSHTIIILNIPYFIDN